MFGGVLAGEKDIWTLVKKYNTNESEISEIKMRSYQPESLNYRRYIELDKEQIKNLEEIAHVIIKEKIIGFETLVSEYNNNNSEIQIHNLSIHKNTDYWKNEDNRLDTIKKTLLKQIGLVAVNIYKAADKATADKAADKAASGKNTIQDTNNTQFYNPDKIVNTFTNKFTI